MEIHPSLTFDVVEEATERQTFGIDNPGFCIGCGEEADGCEPDAREYVCASCGEHKVYGATELFMMIF